MTTRTCKPPQRHSKQLPQRCKVTTNRQRISLKRCKNNNKQMSNEYKDRPEKQKENRKDSKGIQNNHKMRKT